MTLWPFDSLRRLRPCCDKGVSRSKRKAIVNPELAYAYPNRPQKAIGKRSPSFQ
ncbi:unnamed protein product [Withania somnifera]